MDGQNRAQMSVKNWSVASPGGTRYNTGTDGQSNMKIDREAGGLVWMDGRMDRMSGGTRNDMGTDGWTEWTFGQTDRQTPHLRLCCMHPRVIVSFRVPDAAVLASLGGEPGGNDLLPLEGHAAAAAPALLWLRAGGGAQQDHHPARGVSLPGVLVLRSTSHHMHSRGAMKSMHWLPPVLPGGFRVRGLNCLNCLPASRQTTSTGGQC
jgi:hypothetical protein